MPKQDPVEKWLAEVLASAEMFLRLERETTAGDLPQIKQAAKSARRALNAISDVRRYRANGDMDGAILAAGQAARLNSSMGAALNGPAIIAAIKSQTGSRNSRNQTPKHDAMRYRAQELRLKFPSYTKHRVACTIRDENPGAVGYKLSNIKIHIADLWPDTADTK